jgi:hypothetical protein
MTMSLEGVAYAMHSAPLPVRRAIDGLVERGVLGFTPGHGSLPSARFIWHCRGTSPPPAMMMCRRFEWERATPMPLRPCLVAALASAAARRRHSRARGRGIVTAVGKTFVATLTTDQRGPVLTLKAATKADAFMQAHRLLDQAEDREWHRGEAV